MWKYIYIYREREREAHASDPRVRDYIKGPWIRKKPQRAHTSEPFLRR